jgi:hypothetical protein
MPDADDPRGKRTWRSSDGGPGGNGGAGSAAGTSKRCGRIDAPSSEGALLGNVVGNIVFFCQ